MRETRFSRTIRETKPGVKINHKVQMFAMATILETLAMFFVCLLHRLYTLTECFNKSFVLYEFFFF